MGMALQTPHTGPQVDGQTEGSAVGTGDSPQQTQNQDSQVVGAALGEDVVSPPRSVETPLVTSESGNTPGGESTGRPPQGRPATDQHGISSAVQLQGQVLELAAKIRRRPLQCLVDSGATGNFVSDAVVSAHRLKVGDDGNTMPLKMADGTEVQAGGWVEINLQCGSYSARILARVFPGLHKELILGMPWLVQANPDIDWRDRRIRVEQKGSYADLPIVVQKSMTPIVDQINLCSAKQMAR